MVKVADCLLSIQCLQKSLNFLKTILYFPINIINPFIFGVYIYALATLNLTPQLKYRSRMLKEKLKTPEEQQLNSKLPQNIAMLSRYVFMCQNKSNLKV